MIHPHDHRCDPTSIDYSEAMARLITCTVCERRWVLLSSGWTPDPVTRRMPPAARDLAGGRARAS